MRVVSSHSLSAALRRRLPPRVRHVLRRAVYLRDGTWPKPMAYWRLSRTTRTPRTFSEKVRYRMAYDRRPQLTMLADKVAVREYVAERAGAQYLTHVYAVMEPGDRVPWDKLPRQFVGKAAHGSGAVVVVSERGRSGLPRDLSLVEWQRFVVHPDLLDRATFEQLAAKWLTLNFEYGPARLPEWAYRDIPPRVMFEELLQDAAGNLPVDIKLYVFDGQCELITVDYDRFDGHKRDHLSPDWKRLPISSRFPAAAVSMERPASLPQMLDVAAALGSGIDFVRVDLYDIDGKVVFGEMTTSPMSGRTRLAPAEADLWLGSHWNVQPRHA
jgi:hypothetical protein